MLISKRVRADGAVNRIAAARSGLESSGIAVTDLTDSNPTRHGLTDPAVVDVIARGIYDDPHYDPHPRGPSAARVALAEMFGGEPDDYWLTSSTSQAYVWLMTLLTDPGQAVAVPQPGYPLIAPIASFAGTRVVHYRSDYVHPDGWLIDPESLWAAVPDGGLRALVTVNPGNPTGAYLAQDRELVVGACAERGLALISDEVFEPFALDVVLEDAVSGGSVMGGSMPGGGQLIGCRSLAGETQAVTFTLGGLSKLLCAPHLKVGWIRVSGPAGELSAVRDGLDTIADAFLPVSAPVALALPGLLALADASVARTRARLRGNLAELRRLLADGPYRVRRSDAGWMVLVDVPPHLPSEQLALYLLRDARLAVHPGWFYDLAEDAVLALSLLPAPGEFTANISRLRDALDALN